MSEQKPRVRVGFGVMLLKSGSVLLGKRHADSAKADSELHGEGTWTMPGGKLEFKETFEGGALREVLEKTGIKINEKKITLISVSNDKVEDAHFVTIGFLCEDFEGEAQIREPDEITEWKWFPLDHLPDPLYFPSERVIKNYLGKTIYR